MPLGFLTYCISLFNLKVYNIIKRFIDVVNFAVFGTTNVTRLPFLDKYSHILLFVTGGTCDGVEEFDM